MQRYKLNVLCDEVYANGSTGIELRKLRIRLAHKLIAFICDFPQETHTKTAAIQDFSYMISWQDISKKQAFLARNNKVCQNRAIWNGSYKTLN